MTLTSFFIYKNRAKILVFPMQFEFEDNINLCPNHCLFQIVLYFCNNKSTTITLTTMKKALKMTALMLCAVAMMTACNTNTSNNSAENKMAQFEKKATEFKATLDPSNKVIAERLDTIVQKVFYLEPNQDFEGR